MRNHNLRLLSALLVIVAAFPATLGAAQPSAARCAELLERADRLRSTNQALAAKPFYEQLFDVCAEAELPDSLWAEVATRRGEFMRFYANEPRRAQEIFEEHLAALTARTGADDPARIPLLEALASVSAGLALDDGNERAATDLQRAFELYTEALRVRRVAYGERSLEAARGLDLLGATYLLDDPARAEELLREAFEIRKERLGPYDEGVLESLMTLREALKMQGKTTEAAEVLSLYDQISDAARLRQKG